MLRKLLILVLVLLTVSLVPSVQAESPNDGPSTVSPYLDLDGLWNWAHRLVAQWTSSSSGGDLEGSGSSELGPGVDPDGYHLTGPEEGELGPGFDPDGYHLTGSEGTGEGGERGIGIDPDG